MSTSGKSVPTKFYQEDIVRRNGSSDVLGVVLRCWHDAEDLPISDPLIDPLMRPLKRGEVGISFFPNSAREIVSEADYTLVDRTFQAGDYCKRSINDVRSGVVVSSEVQAKLVHAISGESIQGWKNVKDLRHAASVNGGDYVIYDDWLFDELVVSASGTLIRLPEISSRLSVGDKGLDILPDPRTFQGIYNVCHGTPMPTPEDTVVDVKHTVLALHPKVAQKKSRPDQFWYGDQLSKLTVIRTKSGDIRVGDKVFLANGEDVPTTVYDAGGDPSTNIVIQTLCVQETCTTVTVLWQDGIRETLSSTELIPYLNVDEYDCWPGDHVLWKSENQSRVAVVQSVNATDRVAVILCRDTGTLETVSVLELDLSGVGVLDGATNGFDPPKVPKIGEVEEWIREPPLLSNGELGGWRRTMADLGTKLAAERSSHRLPLHSMKLPEEDESLIWFGEVTELRLDGSVEVIHPNQRISALPLERLTRLYDSLEQIEDDGWDEYVSDHNSHDDSTDDLWVQDDNGVWQYGKYDDEEWEEMNEEMDDLMDTDISWAENELPPTTADMIDALPGNVTPDIADSVSPLLVSPCITSPDSSQDIAVENGERKQDSVEEEFTWKRFDILPCAPVDHVFYATPRNQPSKAFLARLTKEYRALMTSLPESIAVRAYEDRTDLLRSLIIGPENTPYEDAPFIIDWMLDSNFPQSPPVAHFHSWTNGNGRVNPNLYEEGKVCLSILGTWSGDRTETWSAARSSLLQAFVSIQGLVLVKEPWFCEPAYEKLRGTEEGIVNRYALPSSLMEHFTSPLQNSRLYNEKAYVLSRGFVRRALEMPLGGLQAELTWLYYTTGKLSKVLQDSRQLIDKSKQEPSSSSSSRVIHDPDVAVPRLTAGGIITLERTLVKLQTFLDTWQREHSFQS
ncbi:hypothetical protein V8B97DRAFT_2008249 [Scleroderma yunnanense]